MTRYNLLEYFYKYTKVKKPYSEMEKELGKDYREIQDVMRKMKMKDEVIINLGSSKEEDDFFYLSDLGINNYEKEKEERKEKKLKKIKNSILLICTVIATIIAILKYIV